jgi:aerobic carbon-monoxide dehydrogenase medium subunit
MIPAAFDYSRPASVDEALSLLAQHGDGAKVIAGGHSLLPLLKLRVATADHLVDVSRLAELRGVRDVNGGVAIGAATTYREALESPLIQERFPLLVETIEDIGDVQVRNRGTLGGAVAHADPASDLPAALLALDAELVLRSQSGSRAVPAASFFQGAFATDLAEGELLMGIRVPATPPGAGTAYRQLTQMASGYSLVGAAVLVARSGGTLSTVRVGITGVADHAYRASGVEQALSGSDGGADALSAAAAHAADGVTVNEDIHADAEYRGAMAVVYTRRALEAAISRAA